MAKNRPDYFNVKGSSPTASLAADLSQNFRLDNEARYVYCLLPPLKTFLADLCVFGLAVHGFLPHDGPYSQPTL